MTVSLPDVWLTHLCQLNYEADCVEELARGLQEKNQDHTPDSYRDKQERNQRNFFPGSSYWKCHRRNPLP